MRIRIGSVKWKQFWKAIRFRVKSPWNLQCNYIRAPVCTYITYIYVLPDQPLLCHRGFMTCITILLTLSFSFAGLAHSWGTSFSRALPSTAYPPYLANNCGPPTFQHSNFTNIFPYNGTTTEVIQQTINTSTGNIIHEVSTLRGTI